MLDQSLFDLAVAAMLSSTRLAEEIARRLAAPPGALQVWLCCDFQQACRQALRSELDEDVPRRFRLNELDSVFAVLWDQDAHGVPGLKALDATFKRLFIENGDSIHFNDNRVADYARFCTRLDPAVLVGRRLAQHALHAERFACHDLLRVLSAQQPHFSPVPSVCEPVAENHVHLGGAHQDGLQMMTRLFGTGPEHKAVFQNDPGLVGSLAHWLLWCDDCPMDGTSAQPLRELFTAHRLMRTDPRPDWESWATCAVPMAKPNQLPWLRKQMAICWLRGELGHAWLWFLTGLWLAYLKSRHVSVRLAVLYLVIWMMGKRREIIMDGQGLTRFVGYYGAPARQAGKESLQHRDSVSRIFQARVDIAELKGGPGIYSPGLMANVVAHLAQRDGLPQPDPFIPMPAQDQAAFKVHMERLHLCIHFQRRRELLDKPEMIWHQVRKFRRDLDDEALWQHWRFLAAPGRSTPAQQFCPDNWVRGIDVAGDENAVPTELFAPALRWLRQGLAARPMRLGPKQRTQRGLHMSVHAGEDYAHPISGLRRIDETVRFCDMRAGDRLGHALALGLAPRTWMDRQGDVILPLDEHVDNLVWLWHHASLLSARLPLAGQVLPRIEYSLQRLLPKLPWMRLMPRDVRLSNELLFEAWCLRRNCITTWTRYAQGCFMDEEVEAAVPDHQRLKHNPQAPEVMAYLLRGSAALRAVFTKPAPSPKVRVTRCGTGGQVGCAAPETDETLGLELDPCSEHELDFYEAVQDHLIDVYDRKGLCIEVNGTSNLYIARLQQYSEHPVFRWFPPDDALLAPGGMFNKHGLRRGPIEVCVNTDDPAIMPTTLRMELLLLREAALAHGVSRTTAEAWVERLRQVGLREFHRKHVPVWQ